MASILLWLSPSFGSLFKLLWRVVSTVSCGRGSIDRSASFVRRMSSWRPGHKNPHQVERNRSSSSALEKNTPNNKKRNTGQIRRYISYVIQTSCDSSFLSSACVGTTRHVIAGQNTAVVSGRRSQQTRRDSSAQFTSDLPATAQLMHIAPISRWSKICENIRFWGLKSNGQCCYVDTISFPCCNGADVLAITEQ